VFLATILSHLTGLTEYLTASAASLPYSSIENIGMTTPECILLALTIFLFSHWLINRKSFPVYYPLIFLILFIFTGMIKNVSSKKTNELIVYNTPGSSTIGIKTGKIINLFSDTSLIRPEVYRHSATLGLKIKLNVLKPAVRCLEADRKKILITGFLSNMLLRNYLPDVVILTGIRPKVEDDLKMAHPPGIIIISSEATSGFRFPGQADLSGIDSIHFVRKSGAFIKRL
jgi:hypothetical protein